MTDLDHGIFQSRRAGTLDREGDRLRIGERAALSEALHARLDELGDLRREVYGAIGVETRTTMNIGCDREVFAVDVM